MLKTTLRFTVAALGLSFGSAHAGFITVGGAGQFTSVPGACTVTFDAGNADNGCGVTYSQDPGGIISPAAALPANNFRSGSSTTYAAPAGDSTYYLTVGPSDGTPAYINLATKANYFGFFTGSLDTYNLVQFYLGSVLVDSFTGTDINAVAFPGTAADGDRAKSAYINYFPTVAGVQTFYDRIVYSSSQNAFETDNHAFAVASPTAVPEPESLALLGLGALALFAIRRKRAAK